MAMPGFLLRGFHLRGLSLVKADLVSPVSISWGFTGQYSPVQVAESKLHLIVVLLHGPPQDKPQFVL